MPGQELNLRDCLDVFIVGGGINGCGIARDLAGRGYSVMLAERDDLAEHTSSASTKLIHGGLRYLEYYEFSLVRKALQERERLLRSAPHLMGPLRFVMPHDPASGRPAWMIRMGLFLYDHLAKREWLQGSGGVRLTGTTLGAPLRENFHRGFVYSDGWVDDARLVVANAQDARAHGAQVLTRTAVTHARREPSGWAITLQDGRTVRARVLVNAAGPWAERFLRDIAGEPPERQLRLVKGSHIVVPMRFTHDHAYLFQNEDGRIIFAIPYQRDYTLIGTTDVELPHHLPPPDKASISAQEVAYLCAQASRYFREPVMPADVLWSYAGVRPLLDEAGGGSAAAATRDYALEAHPGGAPLLTVWGGKITTFRKLAEDAAERVGEMLGEKRPAWTAEALLPGGDLRAWIGAPQRPDHDFERFVAALVRRYDAWPEPLLRRLAHAYGERITQVLAEPGAEIAPGLREGELRYLIEHEWAQTAEDVLWRRSKLGLRFTAAQRAAVERWFAQQAVPAPVPASQPLEG